MTGEWQGGWNGGGATTQTRQQFIALVNSVGSVHHARRLMKHIIITRNQGDLDKVPDTILQAWALRAAEGEEVPPKVEAAVKKRLMAWEEWANRETIGAYREAGVATAELAANGKLPADKQVQLKYLADGIAMMTRDTSGAFGAVKPSPFQVGQLVINAGAPPIRRIKAPKPKQIAEPVIDAEFSEVASE